MVITKVFFDLTPSRGSSPCDKFCWIEGGRYGQEAAGQAEGRLIQTNPGRTGRSLLDCFRRRSLRNYVRDVSIPGFSFYNLPSKPSIKAPGERNLVVRYNFYAQNYFRIYISDLAVEFSRETPAPPHIAEGERMLLNLILALPRLRLRRWILTSEGYDDDDRYFAKIVAEGNTADSLIAKYWGLNNRT